MAKQIQTAKAVSQMVRFFPRYLSIVHGRKDEQSLLRDISASLTKYDRPELGSESVSQIETKRNRYTGVSREKISVGIVRDPDFSVYISGSADENPHTHKILEGELFAGFISINRTPGYKRRPGQGIIEIEILRSRAKRKESENRVYGGREKLLSVPLASPRRKVRSPIQSEDTTGMEYIPRVIQRQSMTDANISRPENRNGASGYKVVHAVAQRIGHISNLN